MNLPEADLAFLTERAIAHQLTDEAGMLCLVIPTWKLPSGFTTAAADLLLRFAPGYPDLPPDMWWFEPAVVRADGREIPATQVREAHLGRLWQRWSRHLTPNQWNSGTDGLENYLSLVREEVKRSAVGVAA